jgi:soluble lytic murein transglycosylase
MAVAKSRHAPSAPPVLPPTLPDRNPHRPAAPVAAVPATPTASLSAAPTADAPIVTGTLPVPDRNPTTVAETLPLPDRNPTTVSGTLALPDRNPTTSVPMTPAAAGSVMPKTSATVSDIPLPDRNPKAPPPSLLSLGPSVLTVPTAAYQAPSAPAVPSAAPAGAASDMPLPDPNPNRAATIPFEMKGTLTPAIQAPPPAMDYASILKPILSYDLGTGDESNIRDVMRGGASASSIQDPAARAFALWYRYRGSGISGNADAIEQFRLSHPDWPGQDEMREKAETVLFLNDASPDAVKAFFGSSAPLTGAGKAALAGAYLKDGNQAAAHDLVVSAWRDHQLNAAVETKILARFGYMLTAENHQARIDRLLYPDDKAATDAALRVSKLLPADEQKKVAARIAIVKRGSNAGKLLDALPASTLNANADVGLRFSRIQWLRRKDRDEEAWKMLLDAPSEPNVLLDLNNWWVERRLNCRTALNAGKARIAYEIADKHGLVSGDAYIEAEFLAGWIALRFLSEPQTALRHFTLLRGAATSSKSIALGEYWLGRTALALGDRGSAIVHFHGAAKYPQYFYGQLGRQALDAKPAHLEITPTPLPTDADIQRFLSRDAVRAIGVARATGMDGLTPQFYLALSRKLESPAEVVLLAELAKASGEPQVALRLSKIAFNRDLPVGDYALPIGVIPEFKSLLTDRVDPALVHALSRQESEFNAAAKSPVGASGLMQLMPGTARAIAKAYKVKFDVAQLTNAAYNTQLGEAHLRALINSYNGSYFLSLAAYNAGGGRVAEWMKAFGDPRDPNVDPVDWIERIPFTETRQYVVKIMETLQLYRSRLAGPKQALQLVQDLNRGRRVPPSAAAAASTATVEVQAKSE